MSLEALAARYRAAPYNHVDHHGNVYASIEGRDVFCGRVTHDGILFTHRHGRVFLPLRDADILRIDMLIRLGRTFGRPPGSASYAHHRTFEHISELLDGLEELRDMLTREAAATQATQATQATHVQHALTHAARSVVPSALQSNRPSADMSISAESAEQDMRVPTHNSRGEDQR